MTPRRPPPPPMPQLNKSSLQKSPTKDLQSQQAGGQSPARRPNKGKEKMKDTLKFPRFVNSFLSNSPLHPPKKRLVSLQRDFEPPVEGAVVPPSENIASSPLSSPIKSAARPFSSHWLSRPQSTEPLESPAHQEAMIEIEMDLPDMETGIDMNGPVEELADPEDFLSFEPLSPQDEVPTASKTETYILKSPLASQCHFVSCNPARVTTNITASVREPTAGCRLSAKLCGRLRYSPRLSSVSISRYFSHTANLVYWPSDDRRSSLSKQVCECVGMEQ